MRKTIRIKTRNRQAQIAHFRTGAGAMGGTRKQQVRKRRRKDRDEERQAERGTRDR